MVVQIIKSGRTKRQLKRKLTIYKKKEMRPKISHFWSPKESSYVKRKRRGREKGRGRRRRGRRRSQEGMDSSKILYGTL